MTYEFSHRIYISYEFLHEICNYMTIHMKYIFVSDLWYLTIYEIYIG